MITGRQIRAARALLDISQDDLANAAGLTKQGISKIEDGSVQPREGTLADIARVFEDKHIEFIENEGVRLRPEGMEVLNGAEGIRTFLDHVYAYVQSSGGIIRQNGIEDDAFFNNATEAATEHRERMTALRRARKNFLVRVLESEGLVDFKCPEYAEYKWFPRNAPKPVPYYIYGDTVGIFAVGEDTTPRIYQITSPIIAETYTKQFDSAWEQATDPTPKKNK